MNDAARPDLDAEKATLRAEMVELRMPHRFVGTDPVEEDDRRLLATAGLGIADFIASICADPSHGSSWQRCRRRASLPE